MRSPCPRAANPGFTLVELLVATALVMVLLVILVSTTDATRRVWTRTTGRIEQFSDARKAFESMTRRISQATLNTYWDYDNPSAPTRYLRQSELRFLSGNAGALTGVSDAVRPTHAAFFQAPIGFVTSVQYSRLQNALNTWGYFIEFGDDEDFRPPFLGSLVPTRNRFRLFELMEPSESLTLYNYTSGTSNYTGHEWFREPLALAGSARVSRPLADNILALVLLPKLSAQEDPTTSRLAPDYRYDSTATHSDPSINPKNQLPPVIQVTLVAADEASFNRIQSGTDAPPDFGLADLFQNAENYDEDLATLRETLQAQKIDYRVFSTNVAIRGAKWSREQKD